MKNYQKYRKRLTKWMTKEELDIFQKVSEQFCRRNEDKTFIVKSNGKKIKPMYAVFIKQENRLRRIEDTSLKIMNITNLLLWVLPKKENEISLFKTLERYL